MHERGWATQGSRYGAWIYPGQYADTRSVPDAVIAEIDGIATKLGISRAEFVRRAIGASVRPYREAVLADAFGIMKWKLPDGLAYQEDLRRQWE